MIGTRNICKSESSFVNSINHDTWLAALTSCDCLTPRVVSCSRNFYPFVCQFCWEWQTISFFPVRIHESHFPVPNPDQRLYHLKRIFDLKKLRLANCLKTYFSVSMWLILAQISCTCSSIWIVPPLAEFSMLAVESAQKKTKLSLWIIHWKFESLTSVPQSQMLCVLMYLRASPLFTSSKNFNGTTWMPSTFAFCILSLIFFTSSSFEITAAIVSWTDVTNLPPIRTISFLISSFVRSNLPIKQNSNLYNGGLSRWTFGLEKIFYWKSLLSIVWNELTPNFLPFWFSNWKRLVERILWHDFWRWTFCSGMNVRFSMRMEFWLWKWTKNELRSKSLHILKSLCSQH